MEHRLGWFAALTIAIVSGLIVQVMSRPVEKVVSPKVENALEDAWDNWDDFWDRRDRTDAEAPESRELQRQPNHLDR
jgi:hypothetical protein